MKRKVIIITIIIIISVGAAFLALSLRPDESAANTNLATVRQGDLVEMASASGTVEPDIQVDVKSRGSGEVIEVIVQEGDEVEAGDVLVRLDPRDAEQALREAEMARSRANDDLTQAYAQLRVTQAQATEAQAESAVRNRGAQLGLVSAEDRRASASSADVARANVTLRQAQARASRTAVESAELRVDEARRRLEETTIHAPVTGTVLSVNVEVGSIVASGITNVNGGTTLMTVADLSDLRVVGAIDEAQVGQVEVGQEVTVRVDAYPQRSFTGLVDRVSPLGVETSNIVTFDVEVVINDQAAHLLRSGMSADLEIVTQRYEDVALIPITAIQGQGKRMSVTLASGEQQRIKTGPTDGVRMVVLEGLAPGDEIVSIGGPAKRPEGDRSTKNKSLIPTGKRGGRR